ncbi:MAG: hypothetical protein COX07_02090 [Bacteroidetes bacterium CG23_combo_of_CG06-09_8_20_14_all_32_9]|nr:MAG: hypothetical protein COX07_02090 [Bacteroidetes bacterium CG23_combo_of_CG06-09_8_20_14_all_32_9]
MKTKTILLVIIAFCACMMVGYYAHKIIIQPSSSAGKKEPVKENPYAKAKIEIKTYQTNIQIVNADNINDSNWGYDIYIYNALYIHQPNIPAINGNRGFKSENDARKIAAFVVNKIRNNNMPPSVKISELDSIGVLK